MTFEVIPWFQGVSHVMQVSTCSNGKYKLNQENVFISLPVELGDQGVKRIVEIDLDETEQQKVTDFFYQIINLLCTTIF